jgi:hypothetical protein
MDCTKIISQLSEFHDGLLAEGEETSVREHLIICPSCEGIYRDLELIVSMAWDLRRDEHLACPRKRIWQRVESATAG